MLVSGFASAPVDVAAEILECDKDEVLDSQKRVHQKFHDSEHPFALLETDVVYRRLGNKTLNEQRQILDPAFKAFNSTRKTTLQLYPDVSSTLTTLRQAGVKLVAHTESQVYSVVFRLKQLNLTPFFERIYCRERPVRTPAEPDRVDQFWADFPQAKLVELTNHQRKPDPDVLAEICRDFSQPSSDVCYLGDSLARDVYMARRAGVCAIWAAYGNRHDAVLWEKLVRISHWTDDEIEREAVLKSRAAQVSPDFVAENSIQEIIPFLLH